MRLLPQFGVFNQHDALTYLCQPSSVVKTGVYRSVFKLGRSSTQLSLLQKYLF